ncbi:dolichyl-phosphate-mannose-protein mannosyltransferase [Tamaricihabitans halophyticus]|uniref:Dolichyl-phosphate-mannose-protein mannosyltransferase n=1 Tax=Tamaricihabitans halophyticus TaxID=1262583 RepID=A0A4R2QCS1_9PSEU|nr:glycosyltransferase family 39 protein [Tamaricihabitans halophyticus]TCP46767.1 dolichyl-phosphate-mannose-protein mannosyltransferase [Tamaricihabitans halophyticus]
MSATLSEPTSRPTSELAPFARGPVLAIAGAMGLLMLLTIGRYGYFGDELYFITAGKHLDWGYADQPPLIPLIAAGMDSMFPGSLVALRLPSVLITACGAVITALLARELGGKRGAQVVAVTASASSPFLLACAGHWMATQMLDPFLWTLLTWLVVRWVRTRQDNILLLAGLVTAVAVQVKMLIPVFWIMIVLAVLILGPRQLLGRPKLRFAGALTLLSALPTLIWQTANGWPQLEMQKAISYEQFLAGGDYFFVPAVLVMLGLLSGAVLACYGLWRLLSAPEMRAYRFLGFAALGVLVFVLVSQGRPYYIAGLFALCWAVGAVELRREGEKPRWRRWWSWSVSWPAWALSALFAISFLPLNPVTVQDDQPLYNPINLPEAETGWPEVAEDAARAYARLTPAQRANTALLTGSYWQASALDFYGPSVGLRDVQVYSPHRGYWFFGKPPEDTKAVLFVGGHSEYLNDFFGTVRKAGTIRNSVQVDNTKLGATIFYAEQPRADWDTLWPRMHLYNFMPEE